MRQETKDWLKLIPAGEYTLGEMSKIVGKDKPNIYRRMKQLNVNKKPAEIRKFNFVEVIYIWKGLDHYDHKTTAR
jgi:hypothetical protein